MKAGRKAFKDEDLNNELSEELADVIHYALAIASLNDIDMNEVIMAKDKSASIKYHHRTNLESFVNDLRNKEQRCGIVNIDNGYINLRVGAIIMKDKKFLIAGNNKDSDMVYYPEFFKKELFDQIKDVKHIVTDERKTNVNSRHTCTS